MPEELAESPYLVEFYGTVRYSIRSIFNGYLGWFSGNPADLDPLTISQKAEKISVLAGGDEALFNELQNAYNNKEMQWVLELADLLLAREFNVSQVQDIKFDAIAYLGIRNLTLRGAIIYCQWLTNLNRANHTPHSQKEALISYLKCHWKHFWRF